MQAASPRSCSSSGWTGRAGFDRICQGSRSSTGAPPSSARSIQLNTESTVTVSMRSEKRLASGWSSNATLAARAGDAQLGIRRFHPPAALIHSSPAGPVSSTRDGGRSSVSWKSLS